MTSLTDQAGSSTGFVYDDRGLLLIKTDSLGLHTRTDRNGDTISYTYTPSGKPNTIVYPDACHIFCLVEHIPIIPTEY